ncbi:MAG: S-layer homology domain-containing protein [Bacillota bacterium]|nr:S-layer homology domain-containing protein [Bacillota bacterium]
MKKKIIFILAAFILIMAALPGQVMAEEVSYEVADFNGFKETIENKINTGSSEDTYIINLTGDIDFGNSNYNAVFKNHTVILGNGHTINLGRNENYDSLSNSQIAVANGASLSLGKKDVFESSRLKITASAERRSKALIAVGDRNLKSILNMSDGVELTGSKVYGGETGSAVNIINGTFNMFGGKIHNNTHETSADIGGAVVGKSNAVFNMSDGSIEDNKTIIKKRAALGGTVSLKNASFTMSGGSINGNKTTIGDVESFGGGVSLDNSTFTISGGCICDNITKVETDFAYGAGVSIRDGCFEMNGGSINGNKIIKFNKEGRGLGGGLVLQRGQANLNKGKIVGNISSCHGGGIYSFAESTFTVEEKFVIANNRAGRAGDDIVHTGFGKINLAEASCMNTKLTVDDYNKDIKGWFSDSYTERWSPSSTKEVDVGKDIDGPIFLKAAFGTPRVIHKFISASKGMDLPAEVLALLPVDNNTYAYDEKVSPIQPAMTKIEFDDGFWIFNGYDAEWKITKKVKTEFVGSWTFEPKGYNFPYWMLFDFNSDLDYKTHQGYFKGYEDLTFRPENKMTREEVAVMFSRLLEGQDLDESIFSQQFSDVESDRWSAAAIRLLSSLDLIKGYPDQTFKPDQTITRAEFLAIAERFKPLNKGDQNFADVPDSHWAYEIVKKAATAAWIQGYPDGSFRPEKEITRAEVVKITNKILDRGADKIFIDKKQETISPYLDLKPDHWAYYNIIEASINHQYIIDKNSGGEVWKKFLWQ